MILARENLLNIKQIQRELMALGDRRMANNVTQMADYYQLCQLAVNEIGTKLDNLDADYAIHYDHNPIHHMEERMKDPRSLQGKLRRKGLAPSITSVYNHIFDLGGIRVVTNYLNDVYTVANNLIAQSDVELLKRKDYIKHPKSSGYRSLHLVVTVPVFQASGVKIAPVEVQIRTVGMDMWASLEHKLRYKTSVSTEQVAHYGKQLHDYADELTDIEENMQAIFYQLDGKMALPETVDTFDAPDVDEADTTTKEA